MSKNPFRKLRGISDQQLNNALTHHQHVLQGCVNWIVRQDRWKWVRRGWALAVTVALVHVYLATHSWYWGL